MTRRGILIEAARFVATGILFACLAGTMELAGYPISLPSFLAGIFFHAVCGRRARL